jgi:hypothetical protein
MNEWIGVLDSGPNGICSRWNHGSNVRAWRLCGSRKVVQNDNKDDFFFRSKKARKVQESRPTSEFIKGTTNGAGSHSPSIHRQDLALSSALKVFDGLLVTAACKKSCLWWKESGKKSTIGSIRLTHCSFGWWLMADADLFWEKSTAGWLLVAGLFWEKSTAGWWLISRTNRPRIADSTSAVLADREQEQGYLTDRLFLIFTMVWVVCKRVF